MLKWFKNKDVAIVGSAASLFNNKLGKQIDKHEIVVRINRGILVKDESSQGKRTDIWAIGQPKTVEDLFDSVKYKHNFHLSHKGRFYVHSGKKTKESHPKIEYYLPMNILNKLRKKLKHNKPSSGLMAAHYICECAPKTLTLYGFDWKKTPTWYYEETSYQPHDWKLEKQYIEDNFLSLPNIALVNKNKERK